MDRKTHFTAISFSSILSYSPGGKKGVTAIMFVSGLCPLAVSKNEMVFSSFLPLTPPPQCFSRGTCFVNIGPQQPKLNGHVV